MCRFPGLKRGHGIFGGLVPTALFSGEGSSLLQGAGRRTWGELLADRWHDADVRHRRKLPPRPSCPAAWVFGPRRPSAADFDRWPAWLPRCRPTCRGASLAMSLGITTPNAPPISGAMPRRSARFRHPTPRLAPAIAGRPVLELHRDRHSSTPQVRPDRRPAQALGSRGLCGCVAALLSTRVKPARSQPQPKARLPPYTSVGMRVVHGHFCKGPQAEMADVLRKRLRSDNGEPLFRKSRVEPLESLKHAEWAVAEHV